MILHPPFAISARLLPALHLGGAWLSWDGTNFYLDLPGGEHIIDDYRPGMCNDVQQCFADILSFMGAAAESREYRLRNGVPGENEDLFPPHVVDWICTCKDDVEAYGMDFEEGPQLIF